MMWKTWNFKMKWDWKKEGQIWDPSHLYSMKSIKWKASPNPINPKLYKKKNMNPHPIIEIVNFLGWPPISNQPKPRLFPQPPTVRVTLGTTETQGEKFNRVWDTLWNSRWIYYGFKKKGSHVLFSCSHNLPMFKW
jgi:hypothetical protein